MTDEQRMERGEKLKALIGSKVDMREEGLMKNLASGILVEVPQIGIALPWPMAVVDFGKPLGRWCLHVECIWTPEDHEGPDVFTVMLPESVFPVACPADYCIASVYFELVQPTNSR